MQSAHPAANPSPPIPYFHQRIISLCSLCPRWLTFSCQFVQIRGQSFSTFIKISAKLYQFKSIRGQKTTRSAKKVCKTNPISFAPKTTQPLVPQSLTPKKPLGGPRKNKPNQTQYTPAIRDTRNAIRTTTSDIQNTKNKPNFQVRATTWARPNLCYYKGLREKPPLPTPKKQTQTNPIKPNPGTPGYNTRYAIRNTRYAIRHPTSDIRNTPAPRGKNKPKTKPKQSQSPPLAN